MGQVQSHVAAPDQSPKDNHPPSSSMESLLAEAAAYGEDEDESLDAKAKKALDCPCIADLRNGPCGSQFSEAFLCFLKSTAEEKGSDCVHPFVALQDCIKVHPKAFSKDVLEDDQVKNDEQPSPDYKIIPPTWSLESKGETRTKFSFIPCYAWRHCRRVGAQLKFPAVYRGKKGFLQGNTSKAMEKLLALILALPQLQVAMAA